MKTTIFLYAIMPPMVIIVGVMKGVKKARVRSARKLRVLADKIYQEK